MKNEKKNIDRLFQEKFRDFEVSPSKAIWKNIEKELKEEKNKILIIPFWLRAASVAALFVGITLVASLWNIAETETVVSTDEEKVKDLKEEVDNSMFIIDSTEEENQENKFQNQEENTTAKQQKNKENKTAELAVSSKEEKEETADLKNKEKQNSQKQTYFSKDYLAENNIDFFEEKTTEKEEDYSFDFKRFLTKNNENSNDVEENYLEEEKFFPEELENPNKSEKTTEKLKNRMAITPNISPIYYNSLKGGSAVDPMLSGNKAEGEITMAYGIDFSYAVSKKLKVRTGVSKINMSYNTSDIVFTSASSQGKTLKGVENNIQAQNIKVLKSQEMVSKPDEFLSQNNVPYSQGKLNQQFEYLEIPVEIEYALLEKRFGVNIIGGASTLVLSNDAVRINSDMGSTELGRAENINAVSFTTNIGLGFDYKLTEMFKINLEPSFKYQVNGFSGSTAGFRPYYLGVYSGVSFKF